MRVKVGDTWYEPQPGQPVMVELNAMDKANIARMLPAAHKYAAFSETDGLTLEQRWAWVDAENSGDRCAG